MSNKFLIETPDTPTEKITLFLPGISGGAFSARFQPLIDACKMKGIAIARVAIWENVEEVKGVCLKDIYKELDEIVSQIRKKGYKHIFGIGKSFGGAVMLTYAPTLPFEKKVLWAPAIGVTESNSNVEGFLLQKIGTIDSLLEIKFGKTDAEKVSMSTLIIHGTADKSIPYSNSEQLVSILPNAKLMSIEGADHSYKIKEHEDAVIAATIDFLVQ